MPPTKAIMFKQCFDSLQAKEEGFRALLSGLIPRVVWIALGGLIFFGVYEQTLLAFKSKTEIPGC